MLDGLIRLLEWLGDKWETNLAPYCIINDYEGGVLMRLGKFHKELKTSWNWKIPLVDSIITTNIKTNTFEIQNVNVTTSDNKTITVSGVIEFEITDVKSYLIDYNDSDTNVVDLAKGIISNYLTDCEWEDIKTKPTLTKIKNKLKNRFSEMGVDVKDFMFGSISTTRTFTLIKD